MEKILVSACLLGQPVRYDARGAAVDSDLLDGWVHEGRVVSICPEMAGGLPAPRPPAEIVGGGGDEVLNGLATIHSQSGEDFTEPFLAGARKALALAQANRIRIAILKERSPSCGSSIRYDGTFSGTRIPGMGATTALLRRNGIAVYSENELGEAARHLAQLELQK